MLDRVLNVERNYYIPIQYGFTEDQLEYHKKKISINEILRYKKYRYLKIYN